MKPQMSSIEQQLCTLMVFFALQAELCSINSVLPFPSLQAESRLVTPSPAPKSWGELAISFKSDY